MFSFALAVRQYAGAEDQVPDRVKRTEEIIRAVAPLGIYDRIYIVVPSDHDCGQTERAINKMIIDTKIWDLCKNTVVEVFSVRGHHSRGALNQTVLKAENDEVSHITFLSGKAAGSLDEKIFQKIKNQFYYHNVKAVGVAVDSSDGSIAVGDKLFTHKEWVQKGFAQNTFLTWDVEALIAARMFDERRSAGCEEIVPLWKISERFGRCLVVIESDNPASVVVINHERHREVLTKKWETTRLELLACETSVDKFVDRVLISV